MNFKPTLFAVLSTEVVTEKDQEPQPFLELLMCCKRSQSIIKSTSVYILINRDNCKKFN